jgi:hypothetical protein
MKPRARRIALVTVAAGCLVGAGLVAFNWQTVRDHAESWWFVMTRETKTLNPERGSKIIANETWVAFVQRHHPELTYSCGPLGGPDEREVRRSRMEALIEP